MVSSNEKQITHTTEYSTRKECMVAQTQKLIIVNNLLEQAKEITSSQYMDLKNPIFKGQTRVDENSQYWMVFEDNGVLYKIHNTL